MAEAVEDTRVLNVTREIDGETVQESIAAGDLTPEQLQVFDKLTIVQNRKNTTIANAQLDIEILIAAEEKLQAQMRALLEDTDDDTEEAEQSDE
tara:strand:- start:282 stop:563 length:282 start_codon:yes stop_codon:yes gene_type:complete